MLDFAETKLYLRCDHDEEDGLIQMLMTTATAAVADYLNMPLDQMTATVPSPIKSAAMLMVNDLYLNREAQGDRKLYGNDTYRNLLNPYRAHA